MRLLLWAIPVLVGCTLISDADQFVGERDGGTDTGVDTGAVDTGVDAGAVDAQQADSGVTDAGEADAMTPDDTGPFTEGSCAAQVDETSMNNWDDSRPRCCFSPEHCRGMTVGRGVYDGRCPLDDCGNPAGPIASVCIPSRDAILEEYSLDRCYLNRDCTGTELCMFGEDGEYSGTCPSPPPREPGFCVVP